MTSDTPAPRPDTAAARSGRIRESLIDHALELIAERGWRACDIAAVIAAAGVTQEEFYREFDGLLSLVLAAARRINAAMLEARASFEPDDSLRDKLFALVMARADAALAFRPAIVELGRAARRDPLLAAAAGQILMQASRRTLAGAGIETRGPAGFARVSSFAGAVIWPVVRAWLRDDTPDSATTMATLDTCLGRAERFATMLEPGRARQA